MGISPQGEFFTGYEANFGISIDVQAGQGRFAGFDGKHAHIDKFTGFGGGRTRARNQAYHAACNRVVFADFEYSLIGLFGIIEFAVFEVGFGEPIECFDVVGVAR